MKFRRLIIILITGLSYLGCSLLANGSKPVTKKEVNWQHRVIPLPHEMKISGSAKMPLGKIHCRTIKSNYIEASKINELIKPLCNSPKDFLVEVKIGLIENLSSEVPPAIKERLSRLPNKNQAYAINSSRKNGKIEIILTANKPVGLLYATITLMQLLKLPESVTASSMIDVPIVRIIDWPDIADRGQWGNWSEFSIPWFAKWKMNAIELVCGGRIDENGKSVLMRDRTPDTTKERQMLKEAAANGIKLVFCVPHISTIASRTLANVPKQKKLKHLLSAFAKTKDGKIYSKYPDFTSPETQRILTGWLMQIAGLQHLYNNELSVWLSEGAVPDCYTASGKQVDYEMEVEAVMKALDSVKKQYPKMKMRIWLSQGTRRQGKNLKIIKMAEKMGFMLLYYDGVYTYISDKKMMIPPELGTFARNGHWLGVTPQFTNSWNTIVPLTSPQFVHFRSNEFADKKLSCVYGYTVPDRYFYEFNLIAMAEWCWNAKGRTPEEFCEAYAEITGICKPELFRQWAVKVGKAGWDLASSGFLQRLNRDPAFGFYGSQPFDHRFGKNDLDGINNLPESIAAAQEALLLAESSGNPEMLYESKITLANLQVFDKLRSVSKILLEDSVSDSRKQKLAEQLDSLDQYANTIHNNLLSWNDRIIARKKQENPNVPGYFFYNQQRLLDSANSILKTMDVLRKLSSQLGLKDPRPESRIRELGEWNEKDFTAKTANLTFDITNKIDNAGGTYNICFDYLDGPLSVRINDIHVDFMAKGKNRTAAKCLDPPTSILVISKGLASVECRIKVPSFQPATKVLLKIRLMSSSSPSQKQMCQGLIGIRKIFPPGNFPNTKTIVTPDESPECEKAQAISKVSQQSGPARIGIFNGYGADSISQALKTEKYQVYRITKIDKENLDRCDVLIMPQRSQPLKLIRASEKITDWVKAGGGILCIHDAMGFRKHLAMFKKVGSGSGQIKQPRLKISESSPLTEGIKPGTEFQPNFNFDCLSIKPGTSAEVCVVDNKKQPVMVYGRYGYGKVVLSGLYIGLSGEKYDLAGHSAVPHGIELKLLLNSVKWLAEK